MNWRRALRDWRVWALVITIQAPGVRAIVRYTPSPLFVLALVFIAAFIFYSACLHGPLRAWPPRAGSRVGVVIVIASVSVGALGALGWQIANWLAAGYVEVAVPALVAFVAIHAARHAPETP